MNQVINNIIAGLNTIGYQFWGYAANVFVQVSLLIILLLVLDFVLRKRVRAVFRYCVWMLVFVKLVLPTSLALPTGVGYWLGKTSVLEPMSRIEQVLPAAVPVHTEAVIPEAVTNGPGWAEPMQPMGGGSFVAPEVKIEAIRWQGLVFSGWLAGVLILSALLVQQARFVKRLFMQARDADGKLLDLLERCRGELAVKGKVGLKLSAKMVSPAVCGLFRPVILLPAHLVEKVNDKKLRAIFIHELAHIKRRDTWVNFVQTVLQIVYFYNPFVWLANSRVRKIREQAVDEMAIVTLGGKAKSYSNTLIDVAEMAFRRPNLSLRLIGVVESKKALHKRIKHMLTRPIPKSAKVGIAGLLAVVILGCILLPMAQAQNKPADNDVKAEKPLRAYEVNKKVSDFPEEEDFSTPEAAYAVINRVMASGEQSAWRRISVKRLTHRLPAADAKKEEVKPEDAQVWLNARILEVRVFREQRAVILAELSQDPNSPKIDRRYVEFEDGHWLNTGQDSTASSLEEARALTNAKFANMFERPARPKIENPDAYLKSLVQFLKDNAEEPKQFVMKEVAEHKLVIMGEIHHRPKYWAFNSSLVSEPDFPKYVSTIYMELPSNDQELIDKFLAAEKCDTELVIEMLRDMLWMGWPDQPMLDFFKTVWQVNQKLEPQQRLRIVLVDMQRPWNKIEKRQDWAQYERTSRDKQMADNIVQDLQQHSYEKRNALFIVGVMHATLNQKFFEEAPVLTAGWYLRNELGENNVYAFFPHQAVETNWGRVDGRLCLGLFDSAFAAIGNKPVAFPLTTGPFGEQPFDAFPDRPTAGIYADGYSAYLYLGPLEGEIFSPLIDGFYTDEFVKEIDRRCQIMYGEGWAEAYRQDKLDAQTFIEWMSNSWGQPRREWQETTLGPMNAWHRGGRDWKQAIKDEKLKEPLTHSAEIKEAARQLFDKIRNANYDKILRYYKNGRWIQDSWKKFPIWEYYMVHTDWPSFARWCCETFKENPIVSVELGDVFIGEKEIIGKKGWPTVPYKLMLKDGTILAGDLPFEYNLDGGKWHWHGMEGIDWHLQPQLRRDKQ